MQEIFSARRRYLTWRRIWLALAEAQRAAGLPIRTGQIAALRKEVDRIDFSTTARYERRFRHEVMAHLHAFADAAPAARGILHLGATSMDIVDNADLMLMREALHLLCGRLAAACQPLVRFCRRYADLPTLGLTHLQPAQLTTVGKRGCLWLADLLDDLERLGQVRDNLKARGLRGATGTQASFLRLLGSAAKVRRLERDFVRRLGFRDCYPVTGQTYSRRVDSEILYALAGLAASAHRICNDLRLLAMRGEIEEPFEAQQVGSSAMPYKRNPMRCERATGLARFLISLATSPSMTHAAQIFERTLDDSSNRRIVLPEAFLTAEAICLLLHSVFDGLVVYPRVIAAHVAQELPFIATEDILMQAVARGSDRQELHERIRRHAQAASDRMRRDGRPNDLLERLRGDAAFAGLDWSRLMDAKRHVGLAPQQTRDFLRMRARPLLARFAKAPPPTDAVRV